MTETIEFGNITNLTKEQKDVLNKIEKIYSKYLEHNYDGYSFMGYLQEALSDNFYIMFSEKTKIIKSTNNLIIDNILSMYINGNFKNSKIIKEFIDSNHKKISIKNQILYNILYNKIRLLLKDVFEQHNFEFKINSKYTNFNFCLNYESLNSLYVDEASLFGGSKMISFLNEMILLNFYINTSTNQTIKDVQFKSDEHKFAFFNTFEDLDLDDVLRTVNELNNLIISLECFSSNITAYLSTREVFKDAYNYLDTLEFETVTLTKLKTRLQ